MWESVLFGLLQGLTEFLPVSSSGHLFFLSRFFKTPEDTFFLVLTVHGATLLSIVTVFWKNFLHTLKNKSLILKVLVALIPLFVTGLFFKSFVIKSFREEVVSIGFLITGFLLLSLFFKKSTGKNFSESKTFLFKKNSMESLTFLKAFLIGIAQSLAVLPGFSRSGLTIWMGIVLGVSPQKAAFFSFLIALPAIIGAVMVEGFTQVFNEGSPSFLNVLLPAFLTAYISGTLSLLILLRLLHQKKLYLFGLYLIPLGFYLIFSAS